MNHLVRKIALLSPALLLPIIAFADSTQVNKTLGNIRQDLNTVIGILVIIATLVFIWGVILFLTSSGDPTKRGEGRQYMIWGIVALAVIAAAWAVANVIILYFIGTQGGATVIPPPKGP